MEKGKVVMDGTPREIFSRVDELKEHRLDAVSYTHLDVYKRQDYDSFGRSFDEIYELKPNQLQRGFLKVLKGSYMFEHAAEYGIEMCIRDRLEPIKPLLNAGMIFEAIVLMLNRCV